MYYYLFQKYIFQDYNKKYSIIKKKQLVFKKSVQKRNECKLA